MACFIVSAAEAVVVTAVEKAVAKKEEKKEAEGVITSEPKVSFSIKLHWLSTMLWGGTILLLFEHIWHGEVVPWFPFLTAMSDPADRLEMFKEMATVGVTMALLVTIVWAGMCFAADALLKRKMKPAPQWVDTKED